VVVGENLAAVGGEEEEKRFTWLQRMTDEGKRLWISLEIG